MASMTKPKETLRLALILCVTAFSSGAIASTINLQQKMAFYQDQINTSLVNMESNAEDMLDAINTNKKQDVKTLFQKLDKEMNRLNKANEAIPVFTRESQEIAIQNAWFDLITIEFNEGDDMPALANAVNQFTGQLVLATNYNTRYKREIAWMDYLGRDILLMAKNHNDERNPKLLQIRKDDLKKTWSNLEVIIQKHAKGQPLIQKVKPVIKEMLNTKNPKELVSLANQELELVDSIETFFHID
jgi:hypothetical protein